MLHSIILENIVLISVILTKLGNVKLLTQYFP